jgi:hypothetical protein
MDRSGLYKFSLQTWFTRVAIAAIASCTSICAYAQLDTFPDLLEKYVKVDATEAQDGPKLNAKFNFSSGDTLITRNETKVAADGFEDHMVFGLAPSFGAVHAKVIYNLHHFSYSTWENQSEDIAMDVSYGSLHLQHRQETTEQVTSIGMPFKLSAAHFNLSVSQTHYNDSIDYVNAYSLASKLNGLKLSATWKAIGDGMWAGFNTVYKPLNCWTMHYSYSNDGTARQRQFRSEYTGKNFRVAGEYTATTDTENQTHVSSAFGIKKSMKLAALSVSLEHDGYLRNSTLFFKVETQHIF